MKRNYPLQPITCVVPFTPAAATKDKDFSAQLTKIVPPRVDVMKKTYLDLAQKGLM